MAAVALGASVFNSPFKEALALALACAGALALFIGRPANTLLAMLVVYALSSFYLALLSISWFSMDARQLVAVFKNAVVCAGLLWIALQYRGPVRVLPWLWVLGLCVLAVQPFQSARFSMSWAGYGLNTYLPLALFFLALYALTERSSGDAAARFTSASLYTVTLLLLISAPLGLLVHYTLLPDTLLIEQQALKGYSHIEGYPRNWWAYLGGSLYLRLSGTAEDPIFFGYTAGFLAYIWLSRGALVWAGLLVLLVVASLVKGAMMLLLAGMVFWAVLHFLRPLRFLRTLLGIALMSSLVTFYVMASGVSQTSADIHVLGLWLPFEQVWKGEVDIAQALFGHGIGSSGNLFKALMGSELSHREWLAGGAESGFGLIFYQTGLIGLGVLLLLIVRGFQRCRLDVTRGLWVVYWANAAVQENLINLNFLALLFVTVAVLELSYRKDTVDAPGNHKPYRRA